eukprot:2597563-Pleurochrysis_carterae.AAC.1
MRTAGAGNSHAMQVAVLAPASHSRLVEIERHNISRGAACHSERLPLTLLRQMVYHLDIRFALDIQLGR